MAEQSIFSRYFRVLISGQTYLNTAYLLLSFPLGLAYFVFIIVTLSLGASLLILWIGLAFWLALLAGSWILAAFERRLAISMLKADVAPMWPQERPSGTIWQRLLAHINNPVTWKSLFYLFLKFPLGIVMFTLVVTLLAICLGFILAPVIYPLASYNLGFTIVDSSLKAGLTCLAGLVLLPACFHLINFCAALNSQFAVWMLGHKIPKEG